MPRNLILLLIVAGMIAIAVAASIVFDSQAPIFVWIVAVLALEFWWRAKYGPALASRVSVAAAPPILRVTTPWLATRGVAFLWSAATGALFTWFAHVKADISLLGVPYWIPLGAAVIGNIGPRGLSLGNHLFGGRMPPMRSTLAYAVLTMLLLFLFQYLTSGLAYADFIEAYFMPNTGYFPRSEFCNVAPVAALTPVLQLAGFLIGGAVLRGFATRSASG